MWIDMDEYQVLDCHSELAARPIYYLKPIPKAFCADVPIGSVIETIYSVLVTEKPLMGKL